MKNAVSRSTLVMALMFAVPLSAQPAGQPGRPTPVNPGAGGPIQVKPAPGYPGNGGPQVQPPRPGPITVRPTPGNGGPQIQPPRPGPITVRPTPGNGGPQIQPPRPDYGNRPSPPGYRPGYWNNSQYYYPQGYNYRRYSIGSYLPRAYWNNQYWRVNDWRLWGLPSFQPGYRWYRIGQDALLVNVYTGRIAAVRRNIFW